MDLLVAVLLALLLLLLGDTIRRRSAWLERIFLPTSIIAGAIGLLLAILVLCSVLTVAWLVFGLLYFGPMVREERARRSAE
jgi:glutamate:Na+ symporter, ESS family